MEFELNENQFVLLGFVFGGFYDICDSNFSDSLDTKDTIVIVSGTEQALERTKIKNVVIIT